MASITIRIPDAQLDRVVAALCVESGRPKSLANGRLALMEWIRETTRRVETEQALQVASESTRSDWLDPGVTA